MAPSKANPPPYSKDERVLCFHHEMLYEAKVLDSRQTEDGTSWQYKIHYKGWKNTWDDWVPQDRVRKFTDENKELAAQLHLQMKQLQGKVPPAKSTAKKGGRANGSDFSSGRGSEERNTMAAQGGRGPRRNRDYDLEHEEGFHSRPSIKLVMPDHLKAILVDDWENVTKNQQLVPLPSAHPVNSILADYLAYEKPRRQPDSSEADLLEEVIAGLKQYFDKSLGRILLYRFERSQYYEVIQGWEDKDSPLYGKTVGDTYGPEHLCRLLVSLPELIAQTNMDQPSVNRLREELTKLTNWLGKHAIEYFVNEYETPSQSYIEKARA